MMDIRDIAREYPRDMAEGHLRDSARVAFHIELACNGRGPASADLCDIGGATGLFPVVCAAIGFRHVVVIDDFNDPGERKRGVATSRFPLHEKYSVEAVTRDVLQGLDYIEKFDVITSFDVLEHLHHSPKRLLHDAMRALRPGGTLIISVPNCMNLRKRIAWPLGVGRWTTMEEVRTTHLSQPCPRAERCRPALHRPRHWS
jgi:2-polyprenyl-3-methyl-5-hydroxy-6-metoxy-1,4-benzoquinol methylase